MAPIAKYQCDYLFMKIITGSFWLFFLLFCPFSHAANFADAPPEIASVTKLFAKEVNLEAAVQGRPLPTNDWWTTATQLLQQIKLSMKGPSHHRPASSQTLQTLGSVLRLTALRPRRANCSEGKSKRPLSSALACS